jgi:hypothetical protein
VFFKPCWGEGVKSLRLGEHMPGGWLPVSARLEPASTLREQSQLHFGGSLRFVRLLSAAALVGSLALVTGCTSTPAPVPEKVQQYYDQNVKNATWSPAATALR